MLQRVEDWRPLTPTFPMLEEALDAPQGCVSRRKQLLPIAFVCRSHGNHLFFCFSLRRPELTQPLPMPSHSSSAADGDLDAILGLAPGFDEYDEKRSSAALCLAAEVSIYFTCAHSRCRSEIPRPVRASLGGPHDL